MGHNEVTGLNAPADLSFTLSGYGTFLLEAYKVDGACSWSVFVLATRLQHPYVHLCGAQRLLPHFWFFLPAPSAM